MVRFRAGPTWTSGPPEDQPEWDAHADYVDRLVDEGTFILGGPFSDYSGSMVIYDGLTVDEVRTLVEEDPFIKNGVFVLDEVRDWTLYVDERG